MILADFLTDNLLSILGLATTFLGLILGGVVHAVRLMTEMRVEIRSLRREFELAGKDSVTSRDSVRLRVDSLEKQMNSLQVDLARWQGGHPSGAH